jgi:hypothetical protein
MAVREGMAARQIKKRIRPAPSRTPAALDYELIFTPKFLKIQSFIQALLSGLTLTAFL